MASRIAIMAMAELSSITGSGAPSASSPDARTPHLTSPKPALVCTVESKGLVFSLQLYLS